MPTLEHKGASIYYEVHGQGFPVLTLFLGMSGTADERRQLSIGVRPRKEVDQRFVLGELFLEVLRHAAEDSDDQRPTFFQRPEIG